MAMFKLAIIAAMPSEIRPLVREWNKMTRAWDGQSYDFYERDGVVAVAGGMGPIPARRTTEAVIQMYRPAEALSVGLAGALTPELQVGQVLWPQVVVNSGDGSRMDAGAGAGVLVSHTVVVDAGAKMMLARQYSAQIVDMEAAAVGRGCELRGVRFRAVKAVSDELDFIMPPTSQFITAEGGFRTGAFVGYISLRPWLWNSVGALAGNSAKASRNLCTALVEYMGAGYVAGRSG